MKAEQPNSQPPSREELENLEKLKNLIEKAISDCILTKDEMQSIKDFIKSDGKVSPAELELCQTLIWDKIQAGELIYDWE